jgi:hypothetical protein
MICPAFLGLNAHVNLGSASRSKAWTVFARCNAGFESHLSYGCLCAFILCVGSGLATGWSFVQGVLSIVYRLGNWKANKAHKGCKAIIFFKISGEELWVLRPLTGLVYQPRMIGDTDCGEICGMKIGRGNRSTRRKPAPALLCPPQIPTWVDPDLNPDRRGGKSATNCLSYGAAIVIPKYNIMSSLALTLGLNPTQGMDVCVRLFCV